MVFKADTGAGGGPQCVCEDYYVGKPVWDSELASFTNLTCTPVECPQVSLQPEPNPNANLNLYLPITHPRALRAKWTGLRDAMVTRAA